MTCQREGCDHVAAPNRLYCSDRCAWTERKRRARAKDAESLPVVRVEFAEVSIERKEHLAFGVETSPEVAWIFRDDERRFGRR